MEGYSLEPECESTSLGSTVNFYNLIQHRPQSPRDLMFLQTGVKNKVPLDKS